MSRKNDFNVEKAMHIVMRHKKANEPPLTQKPTHDTDDIEITDDVRNHCTLKMAGIVQQDDKYLPIFKRLKTELEALRLTNEPKEYTRKIINQDDQILVRTMRYIHILSKL